MRDAFGGAFLIKIFLVFILIYICFTAVALNYAKAFKVKDKIIEYLETNEIASLNDNYFDASQLQSLNEFIDKEIVGTMNYNASDYNICSRIGATRNENNEVIIRCHESGIVIKQAQIKSGDKNTEGVYYTVTTYVSWGLPAINLLLGQTSNNSRTNLSGLWEISGETRLIVSE